MADEVRDVNEINQKLTSISQQIFPPQMSLVYVEVAAIREQDVNARTMPKKMFDQLVANVQGAGALESVPLCVKQDGVISIISGHHRIRAARSAGLTHVLVMLYESLDSSRVRSKQLAHNTIDGRDDPALVKQIWDQISDVTARFEAFIDPRIFDAIPEPVSFKPVDIDLKNRSKAVLLVFLPIQKRDFDSALEAITPKTLLDAAYIADRASYDGWVEALRRIRADLEIDSVPTAVAEMARLAVEALDRRAEDNTPDNGSIADGG